MTKNYCIGIMSGTSLDGADVVLVHFEKETSKVIAQQNTTYPDEIYQELKNLENQQTLKVVATLDVKLGKFFADCVLKLLSHYSVAAEAVSVIGLHGQTIDHEPLGANPYTVQIGDPNQVAYLTKITTVSDFRRKDIAAGGQGAPLVPAFHQSFFTDKTKNQVILNIGGIANITYLPCEGSVIGFDTGPGNGLLDSWIQKNQNRAFDNEGAWAKSGQKDQKLLDKMLAEEYFKKPFPKSTGREFFNLNWVNNFIAQQKPQDIQATLTSLSAQTIVASILSLSQLDEVLVCGGGLKNQCLMAEISQGLAPIAVHSTDKYGIDPDWVEATAFAWLAKQTLAHKTGNIPSVTGAKQALILGAIYLPN